MLIVYCMSFIFFFFFKQKTAYEMRISDWSSDVCSSDLGWRAIDDARKRALGPFLARDTRTNNLRIGKCPVLRLAAVIRRPGLGDRRRLCAAAQIVGRDRPVGALTDMGCRTRRNIPARLRPCALKRDPCVVAAGGNGLDVVRRRAVEHRTVRVDHKL